MKNKNKITNKRKYRIVDKKRFFSFIFFIIILAITIILMFSKNNKAYSSTYKENYIEIIVKRGDTLWNIAIKNMPKKYDVRKMVYEIMKFNEMEDANIYPGDFIKIPIKYNGK